MVPDSTQQTNLSPEETQILSLEQQLAEAAAASNFFETESGRLFVKLAGLKVNVLTGKILSDKFDSDHRGYINAKAELNAYKFMLNKMNKAATPEVKHKLQERLDVING